MDLEGRIALASKALYFIAAISLVHALTGGALLTTSVFGSGIADIGSSYTYGDRSFVGYLLEYFAVASFFGLGYLVRRKVAWAMLAAIGLILADAVSYFAPLASAGLAAAVAGLPASLLVVLHGIYFWSVLQAFVATRQMRINRFIVRRLELEAQLRRKLEESDAPPPPAATFTRYRSTPRT